MPKTTYKRVKEKKYFAKRFDCYNKGGVAYGKPVMIWYVDDPESKHHGISALIPLRGKMIEICIDYKDIVSMLALPKALKASKKK